MLLHFRMLLCMHIITQHLITRPHTLYCMVVLDHLLPWMDRDQLVCNFVCLNHYVASGTCWILT